VVIGGHENYNHKVTTFRSSIIERIALKAPLYSIRAGYVSPMGTTNSEEHDELMKKYGLDRHTASAHLTAIRGLKHDELMKKYGLDRHTASAHLTAIRGLKHQ